MRSSTQWLGSLIALLVLNYTNYANGTMTPTLKTIETFFSRESGKCEEVDKDFTCPLNETLLSFYLYTRETHKDPFKINESNIKDAPFVPNAETKVLIHGYIGTKDLSPNFEIRPAYFEHGEYNIISVDWAILAKGICYRQAAINVQYVGTCTAKFLEKVFEERSSDIEQTKLHVIGYSLGAHVAGFVGRTLEKFKLQRLTALDPALPEFGGIIHLQKSVTKTDAVFVDVIHSNSGVNGRIASVGHVDFFLNNAVVQPGCLPLDTPCSHVRSVLCFAESILTTVGFYGYKCRSLYSFLSHLCRPSSPDKWVLMGEYVDHNSTGNYFVQTNKVAPYAKGLYTLKDGDNVSNVTTVTAVQNVKCALTETAITPTTN